MKTPATLAAAAAALALVLSGCASTAAVPPGTVVPDTRLAQVQAGVTTRAMLLAQLGPTTSIRFDNGVEVWRYQLAPAPGHSGYGEYVLVLDAGGVLRQARSADVVYQIPGQK